MEVKLFRFRHIHLTMSSARNKKCVCWRGRGSRNKTWFVLKDIRTADREEQTLWWTEGCSDRRLGDGGRNCCHPLPPLCFVSRVEFFPLVFLPSLFMTPAGSAWYREDNEKVTREDEETVLVNSWWASRWYLDLWSIILAWDCPEEVSTKNIFVLQ